MKGRKDCGVRLPIESKLEIWSVEHDGNEMRNE